MPVTAITPVHVILILNTLAWFYLFLITSAASINAYYGVWGQFKVGALLSIVMLALSCWMLYTFF